MYVAVTAEGDRSVQFGSRPGPRVLERLSVDGSQARVEELARAWVPPGAERLPVPAFAPKLLFDVLPGGGFVFSDSTGYAIKFAMPDGTIDRVLIRMIEPLIMKPDRPRRANPMNCRAHQKLETV